MAKTEVKTYTQEKTGAQRAIPHGMHATHRLAISAS